jgi:hypothetical protein
MLLFGPQTRPSRNTTSISRIELQQLGADAFGAFGELAHAVADRAAGHHHRA